MTNSADIDRFDHILDAIEQIDRHTSGLDFDTFKEDRFLQLGVERCLEIVSEASRHLPEELKQNFPEIPWRRVADIGNRIRHAYHAVDSGIVWEIVSNDLSTLKITIETMKTMATSDT